MAARSDHRPYQRVAEIMARCDALAAHSEDASGLTRTYGSAALRATRDQVAAWMREAGMTVRRDALGNLIGAYPAALVHAPTLILGSHLDSVRNAGRYDGPLGVLLAIAAVQRLRDGGRRLPIALEVVAFADEEGTRFHTDYLGSRAYLGRVDPAHLDRVDPDGVTLREAILAFGGDPDAICHERQCPAQPLGYVEVHIEQGPMLEAAGLPVGVVSGIVGQTKYLIDLHGVAGHAGTVAMARRHDALTAAAEIVLAAERLARTTPDLVATVGELYVKPGASNVIPDHVHLTLDVRHPDDGVRAGALDTLWREVSALLTERDIRGTWTVVMENAARPASPELSDLLAEAVARCDVPPLRLPSGAGHDGVVMSGVCPYAMLFVRCKDGISHNPAESVTEDDVAVALAVIDELLALVAAGQMPVIDA